jgi:hypothetical protein
MMDDWVILTGKAGPELSTTGEEILAPSILEQSFVYLEVDRQPPTIRKKVPLIALSTQKTMPIKVDHLYPVL